jgi:hypothetical protein
LAIPFIAKVYTLQLLQFYRDSSFFVVKQTIVF